MVALEDESPIEWYSDESRRRGNFNEIPLFYAEVRIKATVTDTRRSKQVY